jgi:hypothetical protein
MVKMVAPKGTSSASINGIEVAVPKNGIVDVSADIADILRSHGFELAEGEAHAIAGSRSALITNFIKHARETAEKLTDEQLFHLAEQSAEQTLKLWDTFSKALEGFKAPEANIGKQVSAEKTNDWK